MPIGNQPYLLNFASGNPYQPPGDGNRVAVSSSGYSTDYGPEQSFYTKPKRPPVNTPYGGNGFGSFGYLQQLLRILIQQLQGVGGGYNPGGGFQTEKFPSDSEDGGYDPGPIGGINTKKYPSDNEDGGYNPGPMPTGPVTLRYPSDNEGGGPVQGPGDGPPMATTMKYPSDNEDGGYDPSPIGPPASSLKFPSDNEDGGQIVSNPVDFGPQTNKYPSDHEDGGIG